VQIKSFFRIFKHFALYFDLYLYFYSNQYSYHYHYLYPHQLNHGERAVRISALAELMAKQLRLHECFSGGYFIHIIHQLLLVGIKPLPGGDPILGIETHYSKILFTVLRNSYLVSCACVYRVAKLIFYRVRKLFFMVSINSFISSKDFLFYNVRKLFFSPFRSLYKITS
jgi:hypothetical protein